MEEHVPLHVKVLMKAAGGLLLQSWAMQAKILLLTDKMDEFKGKIQKKP